MAPVGILHLVPNVGKILSGDAESPVTRGAAHRQHEGPGPDGAVQSGQGPGVKDEALR